jgi:subtilisin family serine protease
VICLALGSTVRSAILDDALADALDAGVTSIAAAGNGGDDTRIHPAASAPTVAVGAADAHGWPAPWSTHGDWIEIVAPGTDLWLPAGADGYTRSMGTSWSCAIAVGVVGLLLQAKPSLTPTEIRTVLTSTSQPSQPVKGRKRVARLLNAYHAVRAVAAGSVDDPSDT